MTDTSPPGLGSKRVSFRDDNLHLEPKPSTSGETFEQRNVQQPTSRSGTASTDNSSKPNQGVDPELDALRQQIQRQIQSQQQERRMSTQISDISDTTSLPPRPPIDTRIRSRIGKAMSQEEKPKKFELPKLDENKKLKVYTEMSTKDAISAWEDITKQQASEAGEMNLSGLYPAISAMDTSLGGLTLCQHLSLAMNKIPTILNLEGMKNLKILSLGRNQITSVTGLAGVARTLEELWISYNKIENLTGVESLLNLRVLRIAHNKITLWSEFERLRELKKLVSLNFTGNPLERMNTSESKQKWRYEVSKRLRNLVILDNVPFIKNHRGLTLADIEIPDIMNTY